MKERSSGVQEIPRKITKFYGCEADFFEIVICMNTTSLGVCDEEIRLS